MAQNTIGLDGTEHYRNWCDRTLYDLMTQNTIGLDVTEYYRT